MQSLTLNERQQKVVAAAITLVGVGVIVSFVFFSFLLLVRFLTFFSPVLTPLAVAGILAVILRPYYLWLLDRVRWPSLAVALTLLSILLPLLAAAWMFGSLIAQQIRGLVELLPVWFAAAGERIEAWLPQLKELWQEQGMGEQVRQGLGAKGSWLAAQLMTALRSVVSAGFGLAQLVGGLFSWAVLPVYLVFLLTSRPVRINQLNELLPFLRPDHREDVVYLAREFVGILVAFFRGQLVIAGAQGILYGVGFGLVGLQYGVAIGLTLGFLNIIPYLGNLIGLGVALPLAYFQAGGGPGTMGAVFAVFCAVQAVEAYVLTPRIMGSQTGLHPMAIIFALFFWGLAFGGLLGMIMAIPLTAFLVVFWRLVKAKYLRESV